MPSQSDWVISLSRAHALVSCGYNYITISVSILVSRAAPPARKQRVQVKKKEQLRKYSNTYYWHRRQRRSTFSREFWFFSSWCQKGQNRQHEKERKKEATDDRENERERKRERKNLRERESPSTKNTWTAKAPLFAAEKKKHRKLCLSTHQMASPEAAAILRELQGKNGNGVRV